MCEEEKQFDVKSFLARVSKLFFARMKMIYGPGIKIMFALASIFVDPYQNTFWPGYHFLLARVSKLFVARVSRDCSGCKVFDENHLRDHQCV